MKKPKISINLTTFNRASLLPRAIGSVLKQTFTSWELIVVSDASTDGTRKLLKEYAQKDNRIKPIFHKKNRGNAAARNTALKHSRGEYVAFLDDDDEWLDQNKLIKQLDVFKKSSNPRLAISCTGVNLIGADNQTTKRTVRSPQDLPKHILKGNGIIYSPTVMTKRSIMVAVGGFDEKMPRGVDSEFYRTCIISHNLKVHFSKDITTNVYEHFGIRLTPTNSLKAIKDNLKANTYLLQKYQLEYIKYPLCAWVRLKTIAINLLKLPSIILR
jgi:glycosyltransferase involved in cell wall biosynthesis